MSSGPGFGRVLLKLSGEALMGDRPYGQDPDRIAAIAQAIDEVRRDGVEVAIVVGGGNVLRGTQEAARLAVMLPSPKFFERRSGSAYLAGRTATIVARMPSAELP